MVSGPPRIVALAFSCDPEYGSEAAGAWGTVQALSEFAEVVVLVHAKHMQSIEAWIDRHPNDRLSFVPVPHVTWGQRANRAPVWMFRRLVRMTRYWAWQRRAKRIALRLHQERPFDLAIHASLGMHWMPSVVVDLPMPSIWGPVSGGARSPAGLRKLQGVGGRLGETGEAVTTWVTGRLFRARRTQRRANLRLVETEETRRHLPQALRGEATRVVNRAMLTQVPAVEPEPRSGYLAFTSPLEARKAPELALRALAKTPETVHLLFIHRGPQEERLRRLAADLGVAGRVEFRGRVPREEMWDTVNRAAACVFTGLREEGGCALAEAMLVGTPVIVLAHGGARLLAQSNTDPTRVHLVAPGPAPTTIDRLADAMTQAALQPAPPGRGYLDQESTKEALRRAVDDVLAERSPTRERVTATTSGTIHARATSVR